MGTNYLVIANSFLLIPDSELDYLDNNYIHKIK